MCYYCCYWCLFYFIFLVRSHYWVAFVMPSFRLHYLKRWRICQLLIWSSSALSVSLAFSSSISYSWASREYHHLYSWNRLAIFDSLNFPHLWHILLWTCIWRRMFEFIFSTYSICDQLLIKNIRICKSEYDARVHYQINCVIILRIVEC